jgi:PAS domain S-box-containing protein
MVRLLPWAALLLPVLILSAGAWVAWRSVWRDSRAELVRSADAAAEYATRVLNAHVLLTGRMNDLLRGMSDDQIRTNEARLHAALQRLLAELPQADAAFVISSTGEALLGSNIFPLPRGMQVAADRDFFTALSQPDAPPVHVSRPYIGRFDNLPFFAVSRRREGTGNLPSASGFEGLVNVSVRPGQLAERMRHLMGGRADTAALLRSDGQMLVRAHREDGPQPTLRATAQFGAIAAAGLEDTVYETTSPADGQPVLAALRKLDGFSVYATVARPRAAIVAQWQDAVATHLVFGLPATLALLLLSLKVCRDHGRLVRANASLEQRVEARTADLRELSDALDLSATLIMLPEGTILHWSLGCERLYGYTAEEVEGRSRRMLTDYAPGQREAMLAAVERHGEWRGELHQRHKDGSPMVVLSHWIAREAADGIRLVLNQTDITAHRRLQAALAQSEERFRVTFEQAGIGIAHVAPDGTWLRVNDKLCAMLGYSRAELLGGRFQELTHPDDLAADLAQVQACLAGEIDRFSLEKRYRRKDGALLWTTLTVTLLSDAGGRPMHFISAVDDITDRKLAEDALAESEKRLRLAQEAAGIGTWEVLEPGVELRWSAQSFALWGFPPEGPQPTGPETLARIHPQDRRRVAAELAEALAGGEFRSEFRVLHPQPDGSAKQVWLAGLARCFPDATSQRRRLLGVHYDISERKRAEENNALLMREVDHRAKNALAVVQAALRLTKADNQPDYIRAVEGRVAALARAHTVLAQRRWQGAELRTLLEGELLPFLATGAGELGSRAALVGPPVMLEAGSTQALCMALHELATNAVKYGALSQPGGLVSVTWRLGERRLRLTWCETGGPPAAAPTRRGFGSRVIEQTIQVQLGGTLERRWSPEGLVVEIGVPHGPLLQAARVPEHAPVAAE